MDKSRLIIIGSQYQVVLALRIVHLFNNNDNTDVIIFDSIPGSYAIKERMKKLNIFRQVVVTSNIQKSGNLWLKIIDNLKLCLGMADKISYFGRLGFGKDEYDEIWYYNYCPWFYVLQDLNKHSSREVKWIRYAEGVYTYASFEYGNTEEVVGLKNKFGRITAIRKVLGRKIIDLESGDVYMSFPELLEYDERNKYKLFKIPVIDNNDVIFSETVRNVFGYVKEDKYPKFVVLASPVDFDGKLSNDQEAKLIIEIADIVGRENIIVKKHPRDKRTLFEEAGIRVVENNIPIEILMVCQGISDRCYLTVISSGSLNMQLDSGMDIMTIFLHPLVKNRTEKFDFLCKRNDEILSRLQRKGTCNNTFVVKDISEFKSLLKCELKK